MKNKKLLSVIMAISMLLVSGQSIFGTVVSAEKVINADSDGVFWIEESDYDAYTTIYTAETPAEISSTHLSGGKGHYAWFNGRAHDAKYKVNATKAGTYKLWYHGSDQSNGYHDKTKILVNDVEISISSVANTSYLESALGSGKNFAVAWFIAEITLNAGENTIEYLVDEKSTIAFNGQNKYAGLFDCFVLAPSDFIWESPSISTKPEKDSGSAGSALIGFDGISAIKIEESQYNVFNSGTNEDPAEIENANLSGGKGHYAWFGGRMHDAKYIVDAAKAGTYKLWYHGSDPANEYHDKSKISVNGVEIYITKVEGTDYTENSLGNGKDFVVAWFVAEITLAEGENTIQYLINEKSTAVFGGNDQYRGLLDCFVLAPVNYGWTSPSISTFPEEIPEPKGIGFDGISALKIEENQYDTFDSGTSEEPAKLESANLSGGEGHYAWFNGRIHDAKYLVNAAEAGTYKLWYHGSDPTNEYYDKSKIMINGEIVDIEKVANTSYLESALGSGKNFAVEWFVAEITLNVGDNTIQYLINEKSTTVFAGNYQYRGLLDCFVLAPQSYIWEEPTIDTMPEEATGPVVISFDGISALKIEESRYDTFVSGTDETPAKISSANLSGKKGHFVWLDDKTYYTKYVINAAKAGTYKLWYHGSDPANEYHDKSNILVNGVEIYITKVEGTDYTENSLGNGKDFVVAWFVTEIALTEGENTIEYVINEKSTEGNKYAGLLDCFVLAPIIYGWLQPSIETLPSLAIDFDGSGALKIEESQYNTFDSGTGENPANVSSANLSGGNGHYAWFDGRIHSARYTINAAKAGTYKLWYHGSDPANAHHDKSKILVNGIEISITKVEDTEYTENSLGNGKDFVVAWFVTEIALTEDENTIEYIINEKTTEGNKYAGILDCFVLAPLNYGWLQPSINTFPAQLQPFGWIEGEDYTYVSNSSYFGNCTSKNKTDISDAKLLCLNAVAAPLDQKGYYAEYDFGVGLNGVYDIFVRTNHTSGKVINSPIVLAVDGVEEKHNELDFEGWISGSRDEMLAIGWSKITVSLTTGMHKLRWKVMTPVSTGYFGVIDAVAFMPSSMNFTPKTADIAGTKAEYELSTLLADYDLTSVDENINLPSKTVSGANVVWTTSNSGVITDAGVINKDEFNAKTAVLKATAAGNSKEFNIRVLQSSTETSSQYSVNNFGVTGTLAESQTITASADIKSLQTGATDVVLIIAHYDENNNLKAFDFEEYSLLQNVTQPATANITLSDYQSGDYVTAFFWDDFDNIIPIGPIEKK